MDYNAIARRWGRAIFDLGLESGSVAPLAADLAGFAAMYAGSKELADALTNPLVPSAEREAVVRELAARAGMSELATRCLRLLLQKGRLPALPFIARHIERLADEHGNVMRARVTSAKPLAEGYVAKLRAELERATGKKVLVELSVDASLLGGVVTSIGDTVIDGSIKARLANLRDALVQG